MADLASEHWPVGKRTGFCYAPRDGTCVMKNGIQYFIDSALRLYTVETLITSFEVITVEPALKGTCI